MTISERKLHHCNTREDYVLLPGTSFSQLKDSPFVPTEGMKIGTKVHTYVLKPKDYDYSDAKIVVPVSRKLIEEVGHTILLNSITEVPITAKFSHNDIVFLWKGIPDIFIFNTIVIDIKVIKGKLINYLNRFNYIDQIKGYMKGANAPNGLIISCNRDTLEVEKYWINGSESTFWNEIVFAKGA